MRRRRRRPGRATISTSKQSKIDRQMRAERVESPDAGGAVESPDAAAEYCAMAARQTHTPDSVP